MWDSETYIENEFISELQRAAERTNDEEIIDAIEDLDNSFDKSEILSECGFEVYYDIADWFSNYQVNLILATDEELNNDMSSITNCYLTDRMEDPDTFEEYKDNALTYLIESLGSTPEEVNDVLFGRTTTNNKSIKSIVEELENCYEGQLVGLTICCDIDSLDMLERLAKKSGNFTAKGDCTIGLYDEWQGGGSLMSIDVPKFTFPGSLIFRVQFEDAGERYTVNDVYGMTNVGGTLV